MEAKLRKKILYFINSCNYEQLKAVDQLLKQGMFAIEAHRGKSDHIGNAKATDHKTTSLIQEYGHTSEIWSDNYTTE